MQLRDYLHAFRARWIIVVCFVVLGVGAGAALSFLATPSYTATARVYFSLPYGNTSSDLSQGSNYTQSQMASYADLSTTPAVLNPVIKKLNLNTTPGRLAGSITAVSTTQTVIVSISVDDPSPTQAAAIANSVAAELDVVARSLAPTGADGKSTVQATVVTPAIVPTAPTTPKKTRNLVAGFVGGLFLGLVAAVARDRMDTRIRGASEIESMTDAPVLAQIWSDGSLQNHPLIMRDLPRGPQAESYRTLRTNVQFVGIDSRPLTFVVTSALPGEGKSTTAANMAIALGEMELRVLLIDGDLRRPSVARYLGIEGTAGLTTILLGKASFDDVVQPWGASNLDVLASGAVPPNPGELVASRAMENLLEMLRPRYDVILIDSPPLLPVTDAAVLGRQVGGAIVVASAKVLRRDQFKSALTALDHVGCRVLGVVFNQVEEKGHNSYKMYGYETDEVVEAPVPAARRPARVPSGRLRHAITEDGSRKIRLTAEVSRRHADTCGATFESAEICPIGSECRSGCRAGSHLVAAMRHRLNNSVPERRSACSCGRLAASSANRANVNVLRTAFG